MFTVILADVVSDQPLDNIFTRDITAILELVLAGSLVYLFICYKQSQYQMKKVYESYESLKKSYKGILAQKDIDECFQNDEILLEMNMVIRKENFLSRFAKFYMYFMERVPVDGFFALKVVG